LGALPETGWDAWDPASADSLPMDLVLVSDMPSPAGETMASLLDLAGFAILPAVGGDPSGSAPLADPPGLAEALPQALGRVLFVPAHRLTRVPRLHHYRVIFLIEDDRVVVLVLAVVHRRQVYR